MSDDECPVHGEAIPAGDPRYDGFRVERLWAFLAVDPEDNQEGVISGPDGVPAIATDQRRYEDLCVWARAFAESYDVSVRAVLFDTAREVERWKP